MAITVNIFQQYGICFKNVESQIHFIDYQHHAEHIM